MKRILTCLLLFGLGLPVMAQETLTVVGWNLESGDSDVNVIATRIRAAQNVDIWGFSEVEGAGVVAALEAAAEDGEGADYQSILGTTGSSDRLLIIFDAERLTLMAQDELDDINIGGNVRAPLLARFQDVSTGQEFFFMVNHLYRSNRDRRHQQSRLLNEWASLQSVPVIAVGDYNYDWDVNNGDINHDDGYDLLTAANIFTWVRPATLQRTQCSEFNGGCRFNSVLDFVFAANLPASWTATSDIVVAPGDFPDDSTTPDHRQVLGTFDMTLPTPVTCADQKVALLAQLALVEAQLATLRALVEGLP